MFECLVLIGPCCWVLACTEPQSVPGICLCLKIKRDEPTSYVSFRKIGLPFLCLFFVCMWEGIAVIFIYYPLFFAWGFLCVYMWEGIAVIFIYYP